MTVFRARMTRFVLVVLASIVSVSVARAQSELRIGGGGGPAVIASSAFRQPLLLANVDFSADLTIGAKGPAFVGLVPTVDVGVFATSQDPGVNGLDLSLGFGPSWRRALSDHVDAGFVFSPTLALMAVPNSGTAGQPTYGGQGVCVRPRVAFKTGIIDPYLELSACLLGVVPLNPSFFALAGMGRVEGRVGVAFPVPPRG